MTSGGLSRREMVGVLALTGAVTSGAATASRAEGLLSADNVDFDSVRHTISADALTTTLALEALVNVGPLIDIGTGPFGRRRIVNILGGQFYGPRLQGVVLAGGADRQIVRADGVRQLHAVYELKTDDGVIINVSNRVIIEDRVNAPRYARSNVELSAPDGRYGWVNNRIFVGTLHPLQPQHAAVFVRIFEVG